LQRKNNNEGIVGLSAIKRTNDPVAYMSDLKAMEKRINIKIDELKQIILDRK
jgi:hypothetical protein